MLSFQKTHRIEGMIQFQFTTRDTIQGISKTEFLTQIQHKLILYETVHETNQTQLFEVSAPCSTLN